MRTPRYGWNINELNGYDVENSLETLERYIMEDCNRLTARSYNRQLTTSPYIFLIRDTRTVIAHPPPAYIKEPELNTKLLELNTKLLLT